MTNFFDKAYNWIPNRVDFFAKIRVYSLQRFLVAVSANTILPFYYILTNNSRNARLLKTNEREKKLIVSLTTFPNRVNRVWLVVETILRQTVKPDKVILWLSKKQFPSSCRLPKMLLNQQKRGLEIRLVEDDLRSHKKYFYTLREFPDDYLITVDDDIFYPTTIINDLVELNKKFANSICCHRAYHIKYQNGEILPYALWKEIIQCDIHSTNIFFTSGGGTFFPPKSLHYEVLNEAVFKELCFYADDVWLNAMARLNSTPIIKSDYYSALLPIYNYGNKTLYSLNIKSGENDCQIEAVRTHYIKELAGDVFKYVPSRI